MISAKEPHYSFDTSALIDGIERFYPITHFPGLWKRVDELIDSGRFHVSEEAWNEAIAVDSALCEWCTESAFDRVRSVVPTDAEIGTLAGTIVAQFPRWARQGTKNAADPFVVAVAELHSWTVISGELGGGPGKPKIPYVCSRRNVRHGRFIDVVRDERWIFG